MAHFLKKDCLFLFRVSFTPCYTQKNLAFWQIGTDVILLILHMSSKSSYYFARLPATGQVVFPEWRVFEKNIFPGIQLIFDILMKKRNIESRSKIDSSRMELFFFVSYLPRWLA